ncbi:MAG TPA: DUF882 domain-containing protein [Polyangia bacterium]|nr:DUF882 domain-containing protein [Polyangia bacterium]
MPRALALGLTLALLGGPARAQAPSLPTPAPSPSGVASKPSGVATKPSGIASKPSGVAAKPKVATRRRKPKQPPPPPPPAAELFALNTRETFHIRPDKRGRINTQTLRGWNRFLRCHHTGRVHSMSTRLAQLIYEVDKHFGFKRVLVVAGYRAPRIAREKGNPKSPHKKGVACDFRIEGVPNTELRDFERTLNHVGVGYYPNSEFVHLDVDPLRLKHNAFWIDYSRPGERARYSKNPESDLEAEKQQQPAPEDLDEDNELAPLPSQMAGGGTEPQKSGSQGALAPNPAPALQPTPQNP